MGVFSSNKTRVVVVYLELSDTACLDHMLCLDNVVYMVLSCGTKNGE